uniref:ATP synthase subunit a n=1 Tax=Ellipes minuta TaxID=241046 RepID=E0YCG5_9ORTH|nr:ATP synthase F0 subunit 6 [Ellipes minuta]ADD97000.1 ATP synthase F0 subunit 6 [Ellipes minuta]
MANLFSSFDPSTSIFSLSLNWLSTFLGILIIPTTFWLLPNRTGTLWHKINLTLFKEFKVLMGPSGHKGTLLIFISLFSLIMFNNALGLFPYVFTSSSHMSMTFALALPLWLSFMLFGWINHANHMFAHLVPQGTPGVLMPFMVCIETISNSIRPGTLAVRLAANMIAGHLLLTLLGNNGPSLSMLMIQLLIISQIALLVLESAVAFIQAYVFTVLATLYSTEVT